MAGGTGKGLLERIGDKLTDRLIDWIVGLLPVGIGAAVLAWLAHQWACIKQPLCSVPGWLHGLLIGTAGMSLTAAFLLARWGLRNRRELRETKATLEAKASPAKVLSTSAAASFHPIVVEDHQLKLRWYIRRPPKEWLEWRNIKPGASASSVHAVVDGPFHAVPGCNAALTEIPTRASLAGPLSPTFDEKCRVCGQRIFRGVHEAGYGVAVWPVRVQALEELQRMHRNGIKLEGRTAQDGPIVLEKPDYWALMLPPTA